MPITANKRKIISSLLLLITATSVAFAVLGVGDVVYDPAAVANLVRQFHQMEQEYVQLVATYQTVRSQYSQMIFMAKMVPTELRGRYRTLATPWRNSTATDTYGRLPPGPLRSTVVLVFTTAISERLSASTHTGLPFRRYRQNSLIA